MSYADKLGVMVLNQEIEIYREIALILQRIANKPTFSRKVKDKSMEALDGIRKHIQLLFNQRDQAQASLCAGGNSNAQGVALTLEKEVHEGGVV